MLIQCPNGPMNQSMLKSSIIDHRWEIGVQSNVSVGSRACSRNIRSTHARCD
jgi:hypothetical protein